MDARALPTAIVSLAVAQLAGCGWLWPLDNPCDPSCPAGRTCVQGQCVSLDALPDGGQPDQLPEVEIDLPFDAASDSVADVHDAGADLAPDGPASDGPAPDYPADGPPDYPAPDGPAPDGSVPDMVPPVPDTLSPDGPAPDGPVPDTLAPDTLAPDAMIVGGVTSANAGWRHTCAIRSDKSLWCWGSNTNGQLGDSTNADRLAPIRVGLDSDWSVIAAGVVHTCAVKTGGTLWCWGGNDNGSLGIGPVGDKSAPTRVGTGTSWRSVAASVMSAHTCGLKTDDTLWCWGSNAAGQLGINNKDTKYEPQQVAGAWKYVALGSAHTCGLKTDGSAWCWGYAGSGKNPAGPSTSPKQVIGYGPWADAAIGGQHSCFVTTAGALYCGGQNSQGELGNGTTYGSPLARSGLDSDWETLAIGYTHSCALKTDKSLWCWGDKSSGKLGDGIGPHRGAPSQIEPASSWKHVSAGALMTLGTKSDGTLWNWGLHLTNIAFTPAQIVVGTPGSEGGPCYPNNTCDVGLTCASGLCVLLPDSGLPGVGPWGSTAAGDRFGCSIQTDKTLWCGGDNMAGQLGLGHTNWEPLPLKVGSDSDWQELVAGDFHACATKDSGSLWCWGSNSSGQLGDWTIAGKSEVPAQIGSTTTWTGLSAGRQHTCALQTSDSSLWCWGEGDDGQIGDGLGTDRAQPTQVSGAWSAVFAGELHTCATKTDKTLWCWGANDYGQLGDGSVLPSPSPKQVGTAASWGTVGAAGRTHSCALRTDGSLWCWGGNAKGQVGDGSWQQRRDPVKIGAATDWSALACGGEHCCGLRGAALWCWGRNDDGQVGDGTGISTVPIAVQLPPP